jgi:hypothetical protein
LLRERFQEVPMVKSLLIDPPFSREEWAGVDLEELADSPLGQRLLDYLCLYTKAVVKQSPRRLNRLLKRAGLPVDSKEPFTLPQLRKVLLRLATWKRGRGVGVLEQLLAVNAFVDHLMEEAVFPWDGTTRHKARRCKERALRVLIACIDTHFGLAPASRPAWSFNRGQVP